MQLDVKPSIISQARTVPGQNGVVTYAFSANQLELSVVGPGRPGTTRAKTQLTAEKLHQVLYTVNPAKTGMVHNVVDAWVFFKVGCRLQQYSCSNRGLACWSTMLTCCLQQTCRVWM
jgi:hypothetical protein